MNDTPVHPQQDRPMGSPKLPKYHHGIFSSQAARDDVTSTSLKENDDFATASVGGIKPLLRVDCHPFGASIGICNSSSSSSSGGPPPVTPSPAAGEWRHTGKESGWKASAQSKERSFVGSDRYVHILFSSSCLIHIMCACSHLMSVSCHFTTNLACNDSTRIGIDGTPKTPSLNLLKPTASSIGHRVSKVAHSSALLQSSSKYSYTGNAGFGTKVSPNPNKCDALMPPAASASTRQHKQPAMSSFRHSHSTGCTDNEASNDERFHVEIMKRMLMDSPFREKHTLSTAAAVRALDPFKNIRNNSSSMNDEERNQNNNNVTNNSLDAGKSVSVFDNKDSMQQKPNNQSYSPMKQSTNESPLPLEQSPFSTPLSLHRRSTWSPMGSGEKHLRQWNRYLDDTGGNACGPATLRSHLFDPVATQLLVQEEETPFVSLSSMHDSILESDGEESSQAEERACAIESFKSMPDLSSLPHNDPSASIISENLIRASSASPMPLFRQVSSSLHDVKTDEDMNLLARPIPRKL